MSLNLIMIAIFLSAVSGLPGLWMSVRSSRGQRLAAALMCSAAAAGIIGLFAQFFSTQSPQRIFWWPAAGNSIIGVDALSAFFLAPVFLMGGIGSVYGLNYWPQERHLRNGRKLRLFWGLLTAGMALLVISRHAMVFLLGWELMALAAFFLITTEDHLAECRQAGWIYLVATHVATLTLFAMFALWRHATGSFALQVPAGVAIPAATMNVLFLLALLGFGMKAGMMPFHFWLPGAHAGAPSHVSALLSGVMLKMGIYGMVRFLSLLPEPPTVWGGLVLLLGTVSALLGVVFAISQHDLKRLLAYHSVENIGIILMGLGLALMGVSLGRPEWVALGMAGCLLHTWNHSLFKSLLFLSAGSVVHAAHTRRIDHLGGLAKSMPFTAAMFFIGAVAICGLPPLNGFISELFVYMGLFGTVQAPTAMVSASVMTVPVLAMTGALALACFVKVCGAVFLGTPRQSSAARAHEAPALMRFPMAVLALLCFVIGLVPFVLSPILTAAINVWTASPIPQSAEIGNAIPLTTISVISVSLTLAAALLFIVIRHVTLIRQDVGTWDCGYAAASSRIQYTASSFAQMIVAMFRRVLRPRIHNPHIDTLFPQQAHMDSHVDDVVLDGVILPAGRFAERGFNWFRRFQQGITQHYLLYILIAVILMMSTIIPFKDFFAGVFSR